MEFKTYAHCEGLALAHFQFTPAYRQDIFTDKVVKCEVINCFRQDAKKLGIEMVAAGFGPDHTHMYVAHWKNHAIAEMAKQFKGHSSRVVRKKHHDRIQDKLWGKKFWTSGYFFETAGQVRDEDVEWYVAEGQAKHWENPGDFERVALVRGQMALSDYV